MDSISKKLEILGAAAKYDVSCSSSGTSRGGAAGYIGSAVKSGVCHSFTEDGRCISLLKVLLSNACCYDCSYCINRSSNDIPRASFSPDELASLTIELYKRNYIEGLFVSSAVLKNPDYTMELLFQTLLILRRRYRFLGYIHVKAIPGCDPALLEKLGPLADRVSVNMEFASSKALSVLAGQKTHQNILSPMSYIKNRKDQAQSEALVFPSAPSFFPAGQTTQLMIGAYMEKDLSVLRLTNALYQKMSLKRVYYSAYVPVVSNRLLPAVSSPPPLLREHRLYQADWLLRFYEFSVDEIVNDSYPNLDTEVDPKISYALRNPFLFPVEINRADYSLLLRVPGIGVTSARRIVAARRFGSLSEFSLKQMGIVMKRAKYFITVSGKFLGSVHPDNPHLKGILRDSLPSDQMTLPDVFGTDSLPPLSEETLDRLVPTSPKAVLP